MSVRVADEAVRAIVREAIERLRGTSERERSGVIYGPNEEVLSRFEIPPEERE
jgi:hypothetical protein